MHDWTKLLVGSVLAASCALVTVPAHATTWKLKDTVQSDGGSAQTLWSLDFSSLIGAQGYTDGPVQTWPIQQNVVGFTSGWLDFVQAPTEAQGIEIYTGESSLGPDATFYTTTGFFSTNGNVLTFYVPVDQFGDGTEVIYGANGQTLTIEEIPEPASVALVIAGAAGLLCLRRRGALTTAYGAQRG